MKKRTTIAVAVCATTALAGAATAVAAPAVQGPSSSQTPYLERSQPGVVSKSIITVGDAAANGYRMVGIPDGLGAYDNGDGTFSVLMNHESATPRARCAPMAPRGRSSRSGRSTATLWAVAEGEDLIQRVKTWNGSAWETATTTFNRFCSADLPAASAFYDASNGQGHPEPHLHERRGGRCRRSSRRARGVGTRCRHQLRPSWLGRASWENQVAMPDTGAKTVVVGLDDSGGGQVYVYVGDKKATGNDVERAGLTGGTLYGLKIDGVASETDATTVPAGGADFTLVEIPGAATMTGAQLEAKSAELGITALARPEDGAWDPSNPSGFYFATTASFIGISRLWTPRLLRRGKPEHRWDGDDRPGRPRS